MWDKLYSYLNDWRLGIAPDERTDEDERHDREIIYKVLSEVMNVMDDMEGNENIRIYDKEFFEGECPYTGKDCKDWRCGVCIVEKQERALFDDERKEQSE